MWRIPEESDGERGRARDAIRFTQEESEVLQFLRNSKRIDLRWLDEERKQKVRAVLDELHNEKKMSLFRISKEVGRSYTAIWGPCRALEIHTRTVAEADRESATLRSKHRKSFFNGSEEDKGYMLGFKNGDLTAWQVSGTAVMVTSTTTHRAFAEVFHELFRRYSHIYQYPMFEEQKGYKWKLGVRLDNSFQFLLRSAESSLQSVSRTRRIFVPWLAGIVDSDGHIRVAKNGDFARVILAVYSTNRSFLVSLRTVSEKFGIHFDGPYRTAREGDATPAGITYRSDFWNIAIQRSGEAQDLLRELPLRHRERILRRDLALSVLPATKWSDIAPKADVVRASIRKQVGSFVAQAEAAYRQKHHR